MKSLSTILFLAFSFIFISPANAVITKSVNENTSNNFTVEQFLDMKYKDFKNLSSEKLNFGDRIGFLVTKRYVKGQLRSGKISSDLDFNTAAGGFQFRLGPFLWGFFLGLLGLLIVAIFYGRPKKNAILSCVIGMLVWGLWVGLGFGGIF